MSMKKPYKDISLIGFQRKFRSEAACWRHLFKLRWPSGFVCPVCGHEQFHDLPKRKLMQCKACAHQTSVTAGTVMHRTRTPLRKWFWAIYLFATDKRGMSALHLSKRIEVSYYVAWNMLNKIRKGMRERDDNYQLTGVIEVDDAFFGSGAGGDKRGRGTKKIPVIIEVSTHEDAVGFARMTVVERVNSDNIKPILIADVAPGQTVKTDGYSAYQKATKDCFDHDRRIGNGTENLPWVHIMISNAKAFLLGTFHGVSKKHLQRYLDEFCYRFNRRNWQGQLFDRLITACANSKGLTFAELTQ
jgi:transposase-like protein